MRFAAIADIHGNLAALDAVLADIHRQGISEIVNLGDCLGGPFDPAGTADRLIALDIPTVSGNHDRWLIDRPEAEMDVIERWTYPALSPAHFDWLRSLPQTLVWNEVFLCHAVPSDDITNWLDERGPGGRMHLQPLTEITRHAEGIGETLMLCGHTHVPRAVRLPDGRRIVNPGSVGNPSYRDDRWAEPVINNTASPDARYAVIERVEKDWRVSLCSVPYDASEMVARARAHEDTDVWIQSVSTGWVTPPA